ncbi:MAG: hypothetical protein JWN86_2657 [Planctomycetota bacterium]|nr:hypothetical protein [Planctomycetota bacterium]
MMIRCVLILVVGPLFAADGPKPGANPAGDLEGLRGTWVTVSLVNNGRTLVDETSPPTTTGRITKLAYNGNSWMVRLGDKAVATGITKIDSTKTPKEIDVMDESGMKNARTQLGIYKLDGDTYTYCVAPPGKPRPTEFASKEGSRHSLVVSKREK